MKKIYAPKSHVDARVAARGESYRGELFKSLIEILPDETHVFDSENEGYKKAASYAKKTPLILPIPHGPGTELKKLLATIGITDAPGCACNSHAAQMDREGVAWCQKNVQLILTWLRAEVDRQLASDDLGILRRMLLQAYDDDKGEAMVNLAIHNARTSPNNPIVEQR